MRVCVSQADGCTVISPSTQSTLTFSILISSHFCFIIVCVVKLNNNNEIIIITAYIFYFKRPYPIIGKREN